jgi:hypothetical protein
MNELSIELVDSNFKEKPRSVRQAIILLVNVMYVDYGSQFANKFKSDLELQIYKNRLLERFRGHDPRIILAGYEKAAAESLKFIPGVQELIAAIEAVDKEHKKAEINRIEAERVSALPAPKITCDPVQMFVEAKENQNGIPTRAEMDARIENHRALLIIHGGNIRSIRPNGDQLCKHGMCNKTGTLSSSTKGYSNFYCADHFRMAL